MKHRRHPSSTTLGHRIRHHRARAGSPSTSSGERVGVAGSQLSLIENGKREPQLSLLQAIADALGVQLADLLSDRAAEPRAPPSRSSWSARSASPLYRQLGLRRRCKVTKGMPDETLEAIARPAPRAAAARARGHRDARGGPPGEHRAAAADARAQTTTCPRSRSSPRSSCAPAGHTPGALTHRDGERHGRAARLRAHLRQRPAALGPLGHRPRERPHLPAAGVHPRRPRPAVDGAAGDGAPAARAPAARRTTPTSCSSGSRSTTSPPAASCRETASVAFLQQAKKDRNLAVEDFRDAFGVTHEAAGAAPDEPRAPRTSTCRCTSCASATTARIYKGYENDGLPLPTDVTGSVEGQLVCRKWRRARRFTQHEPHDGALPVHRHPGRHLLVRDADGHDRATGEFSITVGVPFDEAKWFRGRETHDARSVALPRRVVLPARRRPSSPTRWDGQGLAERAPARAHPLAAAARRLPGRRRHRGLRVPRPARLRGVARP